MLTVTPTGAVLGATIEGADLARPLRESDFAQVLAALGRHGVLRFPDQHLDSRALKVFAERFGDIQGSISGSSGHDPDVPEVGFLSNIMENGRYIGLADAGQDWHTDMSYRDVMGFVNVLYGVTVPRRDGTVLGGTEFSNMHAAYEGLPADVRVRLRDATALHDFEKFWEHMRRDKASQLQDTYRYVHTWTERDVLVWDHFGTIHRAIADYGPDEYRLMKRCQVMATKILDPEFVRGALSEQVPAHAAR